MIELRSNFLLGFRLRSLVFSVLFSSFCALFANFGRENFWNKKFPLIFFQYFLNFFRLQNEREFYNQVYIKPYFRCGAYAVGMLLGYLLFRIPKVSLGKLVNFLLWLISTIVCTAVLFGLVDYARGITPFLPPLFAIYAALSRPAWAFGISILIFLCFHECGGEENILYKFHNFINNFMFGIARGPMGRWNQGVNSFWIFTAKN